MRAATQQRAARISRVALDQIRASLKDGAYPWLYPLASASLVYIQAGRQRPRGSSYSQFGLRGRAPRGVTGELPPGSVYVSLLPVVEACVVVAVPGRVGEVRVAADEPEAVDLDPGVLARLGTYK